MWWGGGVEWVSVAPRGHSDRGQQVWGTEKSCHRKDKENPGLTSTAVRSVARYPRRNDGAFLSFTKPRTPPPSFSSGPLQALLVSITPVLAGMLFTLFLRGRHQRPAWMGFRRRSGLPLSLFCGRKVVVDLAAGQRGDFRTWCGRTKHSTSGVSFLPTMHRGICMYNP